MREGFTVWLTGCSKVGKTRLSVLLEQHLYQLGIPFVQRLDGEVVRFDLSPNLGFTREDRDEHIRRISFAAELLSHNGVATLVSCISPHRASSRISHQSIQVILSTSALSIQTAITCPMLDRMI